MADTEASAITDQSERELEFRLLFQRATPDAGADPGYAVAFYEHAKAQLGYEPTSFEQAVFDMFTCAMNQVAAGTLAEQDWAAIEVPESNESFGGLDLESALDAVLTEAMRSTAIERLDRIHEDVREVDTSVVVTMRIQLPAALDRREALTAVLNPATRAISTIRYHVGDAGGMHLSSDVDPESGLGQLAAYFSEVVEIAPLPARDDE